MIKEIELKDNNEYLELGKIVNDNFAKLFPLKEILDNKNNYLFGYYKDDTLIAFIHITKSFEVLEINNIVVKKDYQKNNIGSKLIDYIIKRFPDIKEIFLEVRSKNKIAIEFYKKNNFKCINIRKDYYENDDAYIMKRGV